MPTHTRTRIRRLQDVAKESKRLNSWWTRFVHQCPDLAAAAERIKVIDAKDVSRRKRGPLHFKNTFGEMDIDAGWVSFPKTPPLQTFAGVLFATLFKLIPSEGQSPAVFLYLASGIEEEDPSMVDFGRRIAEACSKWSIKDVEARLGDKLAHVYQSLGVMPHSASDSTGSMEQEECLGTKTLECCCGGEPGQFLEICLWGGTYHADPALHGYASRLFGPLPSRHPSAW